MKESRKKNCFLLDLKQIFLEIRIRIKGKLLWTAEISDKL